MNKKIFYLLLIPLMVGCKSQKIANQQALQWDNFDYPEIRFTDKASETQGSKLYSRIIPQPDKYINSVASEVLKTLYFSPKDSIPAIKVINYTLEDVKGISAKDGAPPEISIFYSSQWIEEAMRKGSDDKVLFETRGVLLHELTHGFQLEPQGIGDYGSSKTFRAFIEGLADAVRISNNGFESDIPKKGGSWMDGYRTTGYFLNWMTNKDKDFLKKFNRTALTIVPWSFDSALQSIFGENVTTQQLWDEYQATLK